jgi:putative peptidoglycan lipid II flippase
MAALGVVQLMFVVTARLASNLESGSLSAFQYAWVIAQMPQTILGTAVGIVVFPTLAHLAALDRTDELRSTMVSAVRSMVALTLPAAAGLMLLAAPAVDLLLRTGAFGAEAAAATVAPLRMLALGLVAHVTLEVIARLFYAAKDTLTPFVIAAAAMLLNIGLAVAWVGPLGVAGLALANSIAVTVEVGLCLAVLRRRLGGIGTPALLDGATRTAAATAVMALAVLGALRLVEPAASSAGVLGGAVLRLAGGGAVGLLTFAAAARLFGLSEAAELAGRVRRSAAGRPAGRA